MARFVAQVPLRWTDQDPYRHLNNARAVTLLEEARIGLFFDLAGEEGVDGFERGLFVVGLYVDYRRQVAVPLAAAAGVAVGRRGAGRVVPDLLRDA